MTELEHEHRPGEHAVVLQGELPPDDSLETPDAVDALTTAGQGLSTKPLSPGRLAWRRFRRHKPALVSAFLLVVISVVVFFPQLLTSSDPIRGNPKAANQAPSATHWFGTNNLGVDQLSRILHGGQISLKVGLAVALVSAVVGVAIGAMAGYYGKWLDNLLMRVTDLFLAIPLLVALIILSRLPAQNKWAQTVVGETNSLRSIVTILSLFFWMPMARIVRGQILSLKEKEFVEAARALGARDRRILVRHLVPNCTGAIVVNVTLSVAAAILTEAALSFLGYGIQGTLIPTWGFMIADEKGSYQTHPWLVLFPGMAILLVVLCVNYLGDGLRDALDPKQRKV
ncbi:MAG: peptide/nickel transport system permease protein [Acidimicrobiaceae bacterium]